MQMDLFAHAQRVEQILLRPRLLQEGAQPEAPCCCDTPGASHTPRGLLQMSRRRLFVSSTTFPGVPGPHRCCIKDVHHSRDGQESEEAWGQMAAGGQNSPATPRANSSRPPPRSLIAVSSKLPQETGCQREALGQTTRFLLVLSTMGHSEAICTFE